MGNLSPREILEIPYVLLLALVAEVGVRCLRLETLCRITGMILDTEGPDRPTPSGTALPDQLIRRARGVGRAFRIWPSDDACLRRAVVLGFRTRRWHPILRLGGVRADTWMHAHAWVEVNGTPLGEPAHDAVPLRAAR